MNVDVPHNDIIKQITVSSLTRWKETLDERYGKAFSEKDKVYADMEETHFMLTEMKTASKDGSADYVELWNELWMETFFNDPSYINKFVNVVEIEDKDANSYYLAFCKSFENTISNQKNVEVLLTNTPLIKSWIELLELINYVDFENKEDYREVLNVLYTFSLSSSNNSNIIRSAAHYMANPEDWETLNNPKLKPIKDVILDTEDGFIGLLTGEWVSKYDINGNYVAFKNFEVLENGRIRHDLFYTNYNSGVRYYENRTYRTDSELIFEITFVDLDNILVHCYKDGVTYKFYRDNS